MQYNVKRLIPLLFSSALFFQLVACDDDETTKPHVDAGIDGTVLEAGGDFAKGTAVLRIPGGFVYLFFGDAGFLEHGFVVNHGDGVPVFGQAKAFAIASPQLSQASQINI